MGRCPHCGRGRLFRGFLKPVEACEACGEAMHHQRSDDLPPYIVITIVGHIIVGLDAKDGKVATDGWAKVTDHDVVDLAKRFEADGVSAIVYTDIAKDGMMQGCNVEATAALAAASKIPVIASGGIHNLGDIEKLLLARSPGIIGAITGRAIYEGTLDVAEAQAFCDNFSN